MVLFFISLYFTELSREKSFHYAVNVACPPRLVLMPWRDCFKLLTGSLAACNFPLTRQTSSPSFHNGWWGDEGQVEKREEERGH